MKVVDRRPWKSLAAAATLYLLCFFVPATVRGSTEADPAAAVDFATYALLFVGAVPLASVAAHVARREQRELARRLAATVAIATAVQIVPIIWFASAVAIQGVGAPVVVDLLFLIAFAVLLLALLAAIPARWWSVKGMPRQPSEPD